MQEQFLLGFSLEIEEGCYKTLTVDERGLCSFNLQTNIKRPDFPEIGHYQTSISTDEARSLRDRMLALKDAELPPPREMLSRQPLMYVFVEQNGERQSEYFDPVNVPERHQVVARQALQLEQQALENLVAGLRLEFSLSKDSVDREEPLLVTINFIAAGRERLSFLNPLMPPEAVTNNLVLSGLRSDIAPEELYQHHMQIHSFTDAEYHSSTGLRFRNEKILDLPPDSSLAMVLEAVLDWPPGPYQVRIISKAAGEVEVDGHLVAGCIRTQPQDLVVTGATKPDDEGAAEEEAGDKPPEPGLE